MVSLFNTHLIRSDKLNAVHVKDFSKKKVHEGGFNVEE